MNSSARDARHMTLYTFFWLCPVCAPDMAAGFRHLLHYSIFCRVLASGARFLPMISPGLRVVSLMSP